MAKVTLVFRWLPAQKLFEIPNKTQGQGFPDRMNRAVNAFVTNVSFRGLALMLISASP